MTRRGRREAEAAARAQAQALRESIRRPEPPEPVLDVAAQVRAELARQRDAEAAERARVEAERFVGGPCWCCGCTSSAWIQPDGSRTPGWSTRMRGHECAACDWWRGDVVGTTDDDLLDVVAAVLNSEGLPGLMIAERSYFSGISRGLAAELGVVGWVDSGAPPGERWAHLAPVAERLALEAAEASRPVDARSAWAALASMPAWEHDESRDIPAERLVPRDRGPFSDADIARMRERSRKAGATR